MRISCRLTFNVNFKPLIIKVGWELDILCYIFWNSKFWHATFALFLVFLYISQSVFTRFEWKFYQNYVGLQTYRLSRSWTGLRIAVFSGLSQKNWEDRDHWSALTGYSPVRFSVPFRSYEPDLEALAKGHCLCTFVTLLVTWPMSHQHAYRLSLGSLPPAPSALPLESLPQSQYSSTISYSEVQVHLASHASLSAPHEPAQHSNPQPLLYQVPLFAFHRHLVSSVCISSP